MSPATAFRLRQPTADRVKEFVTRLNEKEFGRRVTPDEIISLALSLLTPEHLQGLQNATLSNNDRIEIEFRNYCKASGNISKDEFLGLIIKGVVKLDAPLQR